MPKVVILVVVISIALLSTLAQAETRELRSTLPTYVPTSPAHPLSETGQALCALCWNPDPQSSSNLQLHSHSHQKGIHRHRPHRPTHGPTRRSLRSLLPHYTPGAPSNHDTFLDSRQIRIIDGDTFRYGLQRIRVRGIDAPELSEPGGIEAAKRLEELLKQGSVRMISRGKDVYDRLVADVFVDERNVAEMLAQEGYAKPRS